MLSLGSVLSMNAIDLLVWAAAFRLLLALATATTSGSGSPSARCAGVGLLNKISVLFLGFGLVARALVAARRFEPFADR